MATRGAVGWKDKNDWKACYNHWDSYPTCLGKEVWDMAEKIGVERLVEKLKKVGDWREFLSRGVCEYCGRKEGQPHSISAVILGFPQKLKETKCRSKEAFVRYFKKLPAWKGRGKEILEMADEEFRIIENVRKTGYPDPEARYHKHGDGAADQFTEKEADPLFIEWVYILDPVEETLTIYTHESEQGHKDGSVLKEAFLRKDGWWEYGHCAFRHKLVGIFSFSGPEPDWKKLK